MNKIQFKDGDKVICHDGEYNGVKGEVLGIIITNNIGTMYNVMFEDYTQHPFWGEELELAKKEKIKKRKLPTLKQAFKDAEREEVERVISAEYLCGLSTFLDMYLNPTKKQKKAIQMMADFDKEKGLSELLKVEQYGK